MLLYELKITVTWILLMLKQQLPAMVQSDYLQVKALVSLLMNF